MRDPAVSVAVGEDFYAKVQFVRQEIGLSKSQGCCLGYF